jgi:transposase
VHSVNKLPIKVMQARIKKLQLKMKQCRCLRNKERYQAVLLYFLKHPLGEIATIIGRSITTIYRYINLYMNEGLKGLRIRYSRGRTRFLTEEQRQQVYDVVVNLLPKDVGFPVEMSWTVELVRQWIEQNFQVKYNVRSVLRLMYALNLRWTSPTYVLAKADPVKQEAFKIKMIVQQKALSQGKIDRILFEDEAMIRDYQAIGKTWFPKGRQRIVPTYGKHHGVKLIGVLDYESGEVFCVNSSNYDAKVFLEFLQAVLQKYPYQKIVMVLDNAKIHHAKLIQPFLDEHKSELELVFLPPYSPNLNPIEGLWGWLKSTIINNVFYKLVEDIGAAVQGFIEEINRHSDTTIARLCVKVY